MAIHQSARVSLLVFATALMTILLTVPDQSPTNCGDEGFVANGQQGFDLYFVQRDFASPFWIDPDRNYGSRNPNTGKLILGGLSRIATALHEYNGGSQVLYVRALMSLLSAGLVVVVFDLAVFFGGSLPAGFFAAGLLLLNPIFRGLQTAMMPEIPCALFTMMSLRALARMVPNNSFKAQFFEALFAGVFAGLAVGSRLYAAPLIAPALAAFVVLAYRQIRFRGLLSRGFASVIVLGLAALFSACAVFFFANPLVMMDLVRGLRAMTIEHARATNVHAFVFKPEMWPFLVAYPGWALRVQPFPVGGPELMQAPVPGPLDVVVIAIAYFGAAIGAIRTLARGQILPMAWTLGNLVVMMSIFGSMGPGWVMIRRFLMPMFAMILLQSQALPVQLWHPFAHVSGSTETIAEKSGQASPQIVFR